MEKIEEGKRTRLWFLKPKLISFKKDVKLEKGEDKIKFALNFGWFKKSTVFFPKYCPHEFWLWISVYLGFFFPYYNLNSGTFDFEICPLFAFSGWWILWYISILNGGKCFLTCSGWCIYWWSHHFDDRSVGKWNFIMINDIESVMEEQIRICCVISYLFH